MKYRIRGFKSFVSGQVYYTAEVYLPVKWYRPFPYWKSVSNVWKYSIKRAEDDIELHRAWLSRPKPEYKPTGVVKEFEF